MKFTHKTALLFLLTAVLLTGCMREANGDESESADITPEISETVPEETAPEESAPEETELPESYVIVEVNPNEENEPIPETEEEIVIPESTADIMASVEDDGSGLVHTIKLNRSEVVITVGLSDMPWVTMLPADAADKSEIWTSSDESIATVDQYGRIMGVSAGQCIVTVTSAARPELSAEIGVTVHAKKIVSEPTYIDGVLIANKTYALPEDYNPGVDPDAQTALDALIAGAALDGIDLWLKSGFRSYETQKNLYNNYVGRDGKEEADRYSARPGHSEHQSGLAFDLNSLEQNFGETKEGIWLAEHCHEYGFIIRYPKDKEEITGYMYEPWHIRYLGTELAKTVTESGLCLEEYFGIESSYEN